MIFVDAMEEIKYFNFNLHHFYYQCLNLTSPAISQIPGFVRFENRLREEKVEMEIKCLFEADKNLDDLTSQLEAMSLITSGYKQEQRDTALNAVEEIRSSSLYLIVTPFKRK